MYFTQFGEVSRNVQTLFNFIYKIYEVKINKISKFLKDALNWDEIRIEKRTEGYKIGYKEIIQRYL